MNYKIVIADQNKYGTQKLGDCEEWLYIQSGIKVIII